MKNTVDLYRIENTKKYALKIDVERGVSREWPPFRMRISIYLTMLSNKVGHAPNFFIGAMSVKYNQYDYDSYFSDGMAGLEIKYPKRHENYFHSKLEYEGEDILLFQTKNTDEEVLITEAKFDSAQNSIMAKMNIYTLVYNGSYKPLSHKMKEIITIKYPLNTNELDLKREII